MQQRIIVRSGVNGSDGVVSVNERHRTVVLELVGLALLLGVFRELVRERSEAKQQNVTLVGA